jgi:hypothetical protein
MIKKLGQLLSIAVAVLLIAGISAAQASEFTADILESKAGKKTQESRLYAKNSKYRMTVQEEDLKLHLIVDEKTGTTTVLSPKDKQYMEVKNTYFRSMDSNPVQSFRHHAQNYDSRELGQETFKGFDCTKVLVQAGDRDLFTAWIAGELDFPVKILFHIGEGMAMELDNIKQGPVDPSMFAVPEGYTLKEQ